MSYSFDTKLDRWSELADNYQSMLDELAEYETEEDDLLAVDNFDELEIL